jgi:hypothetical protein
MARERADFSLALSPDRLSFHGFTWLARVFSVLELVERAGQMDAGAIFRSEHRDHPLGRDWVLASPFVSRIRWI